MIEPAPPPPRPAAGLPPWPALALGTLWVLACMLGLAATRAVAWQLAAALPALGWGVWLMARPRLAAPRGFVTALLLAAALLRLPLLFAEPFQSDDIYRYIWEGRIQWAGHNPFALAPDAPALAHLRDPLWGLINHPSYTAIYPPLAQWTFAAAALAGQWLGRPVGVMKLVFTLLDLGTVALLAGWLRARGRSPLWAALHALHPLPIVEFSANGHLDSLMIFCLVGALWAFDRAGPAAPRRAGPGREAAFALGSLGLAAAILAKLIPLLIAPFALWLVLGAGQWRRRAAWLLGAAALVGLAFLPFADAGPAGLGGSAGSYMREWAGNGPAFELIRALAGGDGYRARLFYWAALALLGGVLWLRRTPPAAAAPWIFGAYLALGPVVHPWYLTLMLPLVAAAMRRPLARLAWLWLLSAAPLSYLGGTQAWAAWFAWLPFWILLGLAALPRRGHAREDPL